MAERIRWGILGLGSIARAFATGLKALPDAKLMAIGSRTKEKADGFGQEFNVPHRHGSYEKLVNDPDVDVIYVATPHSHHKSCSLLCLGAGKAVLCEKPFTVNAEEAEELVRLARERKLFLMEAMWTRFFPLMFRLRELLHDGVIGEVRMLQADFGFRAALDPEGRLFNPALAGGSLLDVGVYCVAFASMVMGRPARATGFAEIGKTGVDEQAAWVFQYDGGRLAIGASAVRTSTAQEATVYGTEGSIRVHTPWWKPDTMTVRTRAGSQEKAYHIEGNGMNYEAAAVMQCLREGKLEHEVMPLDESVANMRTMDSLRGQWGLKYPMEQ